MKGKNVLMVWDRMGDYHRIRWKATTTLLNDRQVFAADLGGSDKLYSWSDTNENSHFKLSQKDPASFDFSRIKKFIHLLKTKNIGYVCIAGYGRPEYIFFLLYSWLTRRKVLLFAESWYPSRKIFDVIKGSFLRLCCDGFLVSGKRAEKHFTERLGISKDIVRIGYSVVDNEHFASRKPVEKRKQVLCIARFAPEKNLEVLIRAFNKSGISKTGWELMLVGGGPLSDQLKALSKDQPVTLADWQSYDDLPSLYQKARVFILPSSFEPWGLVVNEAMAAGLPIIVSDEVGCAPDLLHPGVNGWIFPARDENSLSHILGSLDSIPGLAEMGVQSRIIVEHYSPGFFASNLKELLLR